MENGSLLQQHRLHYSPPLPPILQKMNGISVTSQEVHSHPELLELLPHTHTLPLLLFKVGEGYSEPTPLKVGVVLSGGQAPGGQNVVAGLFDAIKKIHPSSQLIGFLDGPSGIIHNRSIELGEEEIGPYRNQGGFDIIGSGRVKIETPEQFEAACETFHEHALDGLIIVGGDDSNTNAAFLAEYCLEKGISTKVVGVPKTIDGDLKNAFIETSFGFDTASKVYSEIIGNLAKDARSAKKYTFFVKMMGRSASHLVLECALQTQINLTLIGEEIAERKYTLKDIVGQISDLVCERAEKDKNYGVIVVPEGLLEFIPECQQLILELNRLLCSSEIAEELEGEKGRDFNIAIRHHLSNESFSCFSTFPTDIQQQLLLDRDSHGNLQLSKIETERLLIALVEEELKKRALEGMYKGQFNPQPFFCGYEGRSALPTNFDCNYCYALGHAAALLISQGATGYICSIKNLCAPIEDWVVGGVPISSMLYFEMRKNKRQAVIQKALVDLQGAPFTHFQTVREQWRLGDKYRCPGPIQFEGPREITDRPPVTLFLEKE